MTKALAWSSRFYRLDKFDRSLIVSLDDGNYKFSVDMYNVTSFPAYLANAEMILLLGPSPDSEMRLLFLPRFSHHRSYTGPVVVKTIPLTFASLQSRLDEAWEVKFGVPYDLQRREEEEESDQSQDEEMNG